MINKLLERQEKEFNEKFEGDGLYGDYGYGDGTFDRYEDVWNWHKNSIKEILQSQIEIVLNYTPDLCENSKEFKEYLISSLKAELEELNK